MKIAYFNTLYYPKRIGGAEKSVQILAESMAKEGHEVISISLIHPNNIISYRYHNNVKCYYIPLKNIYWPFSGDNNEIDRILWHLIDIYNGRMIPPIKRIIEEENPDIVHTNNLSGFSTSVWRIAKSHNIPLVHTLRDHYLMCHLSLMFRNGVNCVTPCLRCRLFGLHKRNQSNLPDAVVGISKYILEKHISCRYFSSVQIRKVIHNSIDISPFNRTYSNDRLKFGYLGRVEYSKGIGIYLDIAEKYNNKSIEFHVAGSVKDKIIFNRIQNLPANCFYHGFVDSNEFLKVIDVLIVPSLMNEAFGRIILEAYSNGVPVIGSNMGGMPEIIEDGKTGYVFESENIADLESKIFLFLDNPKIIKLMQKYIKKKINEFTVERINSQYLKIYHTILEQYED
jgi:glycosyltransferase involved in cell wall biosynthesis